jgi:hypothetical protein
MTFLWNDKQRRSTCKPAAGFWLRKSKTVLEMAIVTKIEKALLYRDVLDVFFELDGWRFRTPEVNFYRRCNTPGILAVLDSFSE